MTSLILLRDWQASQYEFWRPVEGFPGYEVSNFGRFRSYWQRGFKKGRRGYVTMLGDTPTILNQHPNWQGYMRVYLYKPIRATGTANGRRACFFAHRVVATAFFNNGDNLPEVNHRTGLKSDNRIENLEWKSCEANKQHARNELGVLKARYTGKKLGPDAVQEIRNRALAGESYEAIGRAFNRSWRQVHNIVSRRAHASVA